MDLITLDNLQRALAAIWQAVISALSGKQNIINDLETIRRGASKGDTSLQTESPRTHPFIIVHDKRLFIVCSKGVLQEGDVPVFARRLTVTKHLHDQGDRIKVKGWIRPKLYGIRGHLPLYFNLVMVNIDYIPSILPYGEFDYWEVFTQENTTELLTDLLDTIETNISNFEGNQGEQGSDVTSVSLRLTGRRLGICIERDGVMITNYMPFGIRFNEEDQEYVFKL